MKCVSIPPDPLFLDTHYTISSSWLWAGGVDLVAARNKDDTISVYGVDPVFLDPDSMIAHSGSGSLRINGSPVSCSEEIGDRIPR